MSIPTNVTIPAAPPSIADRHEEARAGAVPRMLRGHMPALDGVRGLAIILVMLLHFIGNTTPTNAFERIVVYVTGYGLLGVELFFVLSGFLITGILYDSRYRPRFFRNFYMRRTLRIFPLYYGTLIVVLLLVPMIPGLQSQALDDIRENQAWLWFYGANVFHALQGEWALSYVNHFWSLAIEEHFYLLWPPFVWILRDRPRVLMWSSLGIAVASRIGSIVASEISSSATIGMMTPLHIQGIALGSFLAIAARQPGGLDIILRWLPRIAAGAAGLLAASFLLHLVTTFGHPLLAALRPSLFVILFACLLIGALNSKEQSLTSKLFTSRVMVFFGTYSYGLYVYHHFISYYFMRHGTEFVLAEYLGSHGLAVLLQASLGSAASIVIAYASYHLYEKMFLRLRSRFAP